MSSNILVVDQDEEMTQLVSRKLKENGYFPIEAHEGEEGFEIFRNRQLDLIILDFKLPKINGKQLCRRIRRESDVPIIILTAETEEKDHIDGLNIGADDYVTKPFSVAELMARVNAVLRRTGAREEPEEITHGPLTVSLTRHIAILNIRKIELTTVEFKILKTLVKHPGRIFNRSQLLRLIQGEEYSGSNRTIDVHITNLRSKLEKNPHEPELIHTVYGAGYKFELGPGVAREIRSAGDKA